MSGIMMLANPDWLAFHERHSIGKLAIFYASPHKRTKREHLDPLFCVHPGKQPRNIIAVGRIQAQVILDQNAAWGNYGPALGASTETEWRKQASAVLENSRNTYGGEMLAIELIDFRFFPTPIAPQSIGLTDTGWGDKKEAGIEASIRLLRLLEGEPSTDASKPKDLRQILSVGAGFGRSENNKLVEESAIAAVKKHYECEGWNVHSVERQKCGFDLECYKAGKMENVEVKGISGTEQSFIITAGEVEQARTNRNFVLVVVTSSLSGSPVLTRYSGPEFISCFGLSVVQYRAVLRK
jgi:Domain of unknown function (DUF3883)